MCYFNPVIKYHRVPELKKTRQRDRSRIPISKPRYKRINKIPPAIRTFTRQHQRPPQRAVSPLCTHVQAPFFHRHILSISKQPSKPHNSSRILTKLPQCGNERRSIIESDLPRASVSSLTAGIGRVVKAVNELSVGIIVAIEQHRHRESVQIGARGQDTIHVRRQQFRVRARPASWSLRKL